MKPQLALRSPTPMPMLLRHLPPLHIPITASNLFLNAKPLHCLQSYGRHRETLKTVRYKCNAASDKSILFEQHKLIVEVKERLQIEHGNLPTGKNGRDDEEMILWFLKDRKFNVDDAVAKLVKALVWREEFGVENLTEESIQNIASTGKAYLHEFPDIEGRPVLVVVAAKHLPAKHDLLESQKLCVYLIEIALSRLPPGEEKMLGIFDLRGFTVQNGDLAFIKFLIDVFYYYYPKRIGQVLFVDAPLIFQPGWNIVKPWLKSYANLVDNDIGKRLWDHDKATKVWRYELA
ncbi:phosphatidylinositol transfer protein CSR1 isoform X2 [Cryptomeria japonica]|uniref:phosphatidylinositol transfer protein CSR1 isoform X2 n=1 Tax=Cryptomeria japonica TaxID=3369 RepID=UPI0027DA9708|nr:phosphatidylinositol transfer protein CSR1 isoform X2 [Cryptomeria japonica]